MRTYPFIYTEEFYEKWLIYFNQWAKDERFLENIIFIVNSVIYLIIIFGYILYWDLFSSFN